MKDMGAIYDRMNGQIDEAHRHNYYTILLIENAEGKHIIDFKTYNLGDNQVFFVAPGQVHQLVTRNRPSGIALLFTQQFLIENNIDDCFISDINVFHSYGDAPPLVLDEIQKNSLFELAYKMEEALQNKARFTYEAIGAYLKLFLIQCYNSCSLSQESNTQIVEASLSILRAFKTNIEEYYTQTHDVRSYAEKLAISADHLNKTVHKLTAKTAKELIQARITTEAKRMLLHSDKSAKEIAYYLGFQDPAYFSRFFKKCTGLSISAFKKQQHL